MNNIENEYKIIPPHILQLVARRNPNATLDPMLHGYEMIFNKFKIPRTGVIHLGGHVGQELPMYAALGFNRVVMVEPLDKEFKELQERVNNYNSMFDSLADFLGEEASSKAYAINCAVSDESNTAVLYRTRMSSLSSLFKPITSDFSNQWNEETTYDKINVQCITIDALAERLPYGWKAKDFSYLRMNVQGAELIALKGAKEFLDTVYIIDFEVNLTPRYEDIPSKADFRATLEDCGFSKILSYHAGPSIANEIYIRNSILKTL